MAIDPIYIFIVFLGLSMAMSFFSERRKNAQVKKASKEQSEAVKALHKIFSDMQTKLLGTESKIGTVLLGLKNVIPQKGSSRVYALLLQRGLETKMFVHPANTFEAVADIASKEFGNDWLIISSAHSDVIPSPIEFPVMKEKEKEENKEKNVKNYINYLKYAKDNFTSEPAQKKVVDTIISNIEKHYGKSNNSAS